MIRCLKIVVVIIILSFFGISAKLFGQSIHFKQLNTGTKATIKSFHQAFDGTLFFLTDKIYELKDSSWVKRTFPVEGRVTQFYPISTEEIWFSIDQVTHTSMLYHYKNGKTENIRSPFSNNITAIYFYNENKAIFTSFADIAIFENGKFTLLPPSPSRQAIYKLSSLDFKTFYMASNYGEFFKYHNGSYYNPIPEKNVKDFCQTVSNQGYMLIDNELYRFEGNTITLVEQLAKLQDFERLLYLNDKSLLIMSVKGKLLRYKNGVFSTVKIAANHMLCEMLVDNEGGIWVTGENGAIFYAGKKKITTISSHDQGFSSKKLIPYGISTDDEYGVGIADFDNDGKKDIYVVRIFEQNRLYHHKTQPANDAALRGFMDEASKRNALGTFDNGSSETSELKLGVSIADVDNDDDQDVYLCYLNSNNKLLLNKGNGTFRNVSYQKGRASDNYKRSNMAAFSDIDLDGDLDLFITSEEGSNRLFANNGTGNFTDITASAGLLTESGGMCASFADINNDGYPDLGVSFWYPQNRIYLNETKANKISFRDITKHTDVGKIPPAKSNGLAFADVNNDGNIDLYIANRNASSRLYVNNGQGMFKDATATYFDVEKFIGNGAVFADFNLDGFLDLYLTNVGENILYINQAGKKFKNMTGVYGAELSGYSTGSAVSDIDGDGDPDLYVANYTNGNSQLFLNINEKGASVKMNLHGIYSNKDAIGAKVWLYSVATSTPKLIGYREVAAGGGYGSTNDKELIFGVGKAEKLMAKIKFPSSADTLVVKDLKAGRFLDIYEVSGYKAHFSKASSWTVRFLSDPELQTEMLKYIFIITMLMFYNIKLVPKIKRIISISLASSFVIFLIFIGVNSLFLFQGISFNFFIAPITALILLFILYLLSGRILLRRLANEQQLMLREKLARDLHDDLASTLGSISIYSQTLNQITPLQETGPNLPNKIARLTQTAIQSISDIIWMTSPRNDTLQSLILKTSNYLLEVLQDNNIGYSQQIEIPEQPITIRESLRNDAFLILKEALHNIIKHSGAKLVTFKASLHVSTCTMVLKDDGKGIASSTANFKSGSGNGLLNMQRRAKESQIEFAIISQAGKGTEILLIFKI